MSATDAYDQHILTLNRDADAADQRADLLQRKLIPRASNHWKSLIRQRSQSPALVPARALCDARREVVELVRELRELN